MSRRFFSAGLNRISTKSHIATSQSRAERSQRKSERFEQHRLAIRQRRAARHERYLNAFKRAGSAFRLWWLMLLGVMAKVASPIVGRSTVGSRRSQSQHSMMTPVLERLNLEPLGMRACCPAFLDAFRKAASTVFRLSTTNEPRRSRVFIPSQQQLELLESRVLLTDFVQGITARWSLPATDISTAAARGTTQTMRIRLSRSLSGCRKPLDRIVCQFSNRIWLRLSASLQRPKHIVSADGYFTGSEGSWTFYSAGSHMTFRFHSDYSIVDTGWLANLTVVPNQSPTGLNLSNTTMPENNLANAVVGSFTSSDPDPDQTFGYSLVTGAGDADNNAFSISGNQLMANAAFDFETKHAYNIGYVRRTTVDVV